MSENTQSDSLFKWTYENHMYRLMLNDIAFGSVYYSSMVSKNDPKVWAASVYLPGQQKKFGSLFEDRHEAQKKVEQFIARWFGALPLVELIEQTQDYPVRLHHDDSVRYYHLTSYLASDRTDLDDALVAAQEHEDFNAILDRDMIELNNTPLIQEAMST